MKEEERGIGNIEGRWELELPSIKQAYAGIFFLHFFLFFFF